MLLGYLYVFFGKCLFRFSAHFLIGLFLFIYLFMATLGLRCCVRAFSLCSEQGLLFIVVHRLLIALASLVVEHGLFVRGLQ